MRRRYLDLGNKRERFTERINEAAVQGYIPSGTVDEKLQREMIASASRAQAAAAGDARIFDFSFAREASEALKQKFRLRSGQESRVSI